LPYTYGDLPDTIRTKAFWPLSRVLWLGYTQLGYKAFEDVMPIVPEIAYDFIKIRLDEAIMTARDCIDGKLPNAEKTMAYMLFPPVTTVRTDLQQGLSKLLYGDSIDISFVILYDLTSEVVFIFNGHCEDGIPLDWWLVGPNDEDILERRHMKYGYKIKEIPQKAKNMTKTGDMLIDILRDIRNERSPQWGMSTYQLGLTWGYATLAIAATLSNYESTGALWDGIQSKMHYGLPDYWFMYHPWPPFLQTLTMQGRSKTIRVLTEMGVESRMYCQGIEDPIVKFYQEHFPEMWQLSVKDMEEGVVTPRMTLECSPPDLKNKKTYEKEEFAWKFLEGSRVTAESLGMTFDEFLGGVLLDITPEFPLDGKVSKELIISKGIGRNTEFVK
jgi:hypothetical protein